MRCWPNTKVKILAGEFKNLEKIVLKVRKDRVILKDAFRYTKNKKMYNVNIHISNILILK